MKMKNEGYFAADTLLTLSAFIRATFLLALITYSQTSPSLSLSVCHLKIHSQLMVLTEVCNAWSALDVFCVSIAAALLEIQQFAAFIVGDACDGINEVH